MSNLNDAPADMPLPGDEDSDVLGTATEPQGGDATYEGPELDEDAAIEFVCVDVKAKSGPNKFKPGEIREQAVFLLAVKGKEKDGALAWYTSFSLHEKSKLPGTYTAFGIDQPKAGESVRKSVFIGKTVKGSIVNKPTKDGKKTFPRIDRLVAPKKGKKA